MKRASSTGDGAFVEDFCNWQRIPEYEEFIRTSPAASIARELMASEHVRLYHDHLLVKEPKTQQRTPWHQDQPYYNVDGMQNVSMWAPVDPVAPESTLEFLAGSHRMGWLMPRTFMDNQAKWFPEGSLVELPQIDGNDDPQVYFGRIYSRKRFHQVTLDGTGGTLATTTAAPGAPGTGARGGFLGLGRRCLGRGRRDRVDRGRGFAHGP